jgi:threonine/homoserine/homoserine lactone efflux protein
VLHAAAAASGAAALLAEHPRALELLRLVGGGVLVWLGVRAGRAAVLPRNLGLTRVRSGGQFLSGFWVNATNPMVTVFFLTVLPHFAAAAPGRSAGERSLVLALCYMAISCAVGMAVAFAARHVAAWMQQHPMALRSLHAATAAAFLLLALRVAWPLLVPSA